MLLIAFALLSLAVLLGMVLATWHLWATEGGALPPFAFGLTHGIIGAAGWTVLAWALLGGNRPVGAFGWDGLALLGGALGVGIAIPLLARTRGRGVGVSLALHGSVAVIGYVILVAYVSVR